MASAIVPILAASVAVNNMSAINNMGMSNGFVCDGTNGYFVIFATLIIILFIFVFAQYFFWLLNMIVGDVFHSKKEALLNLIPFYWVYGIVYKNFKKLQ
jgi:hypothetical protein